MQIDVSDVASMEAVGAQLARCCPPGSKLFLQGELGVGKTTLVRGFLRQMGYQGIVKSPTYTLVEPYALADDTEVFHFDLYRIDDPKDLINIGIRDYFSTAAICLVEWPERGTHLLGQCDLSVTMQYHGQHRRMQLSYATSRGQSMMTSLTSLTSKNIIIHNKNNHI